MPDFYDISTGDYTQEDSDLALLEAVLEDWTLRGLLEETEDTSVWAIGTGEGE